MKVADIIKNIFSICEYNETHYIFRFMGITIKYPKLRYYIQKKSTPFYYYKKHNIDIRTLPPAKGQTRDIQLANLVLLLEMDFVCKQNNLKYWIDGGTQLGAVRHKGYIPWDDDIDTGMLRDDYNKIIEAFEKSSRDPNIYADYVRGNPCYSNYIIKVKHRLCPHIFVDIFPFDMYGEKHSIEKQIELSKEMKKYRKEIESVCVKEMSDVSLKIKIDEMMKKYVWTNKNPEKIQDSELVWGLDYGHPWKNWFTYYDVIFPLNEIEFEGFMFPCMHNPDAFLKRLYGKYMEYPNRITMGHSMLLKLTNLDKKVIAMLKNRLEQW